jgi:hypothetical protein
MRGVVEQNKNQDKSNLYRHRFISAVIFSILICLSSTQSVFGALPWTSTIDTYNPPGISPLYDARSIELRTFPSNPNDLYFFMDLATTVPANLFNVPGKKPWALISIYFTKPATLGGNSENIRIYVPSNFNQNLQYNKYSTKIAAAVPNSDGSTKQSLNHCDPRIYADVDTYSWLGFVINKACAGIPDSFWVAGYITDDANGSTYDFAPTVAEFVSITSSPVVPTPTPTPTQSVKKFQVLNWDSLAKSYPLSKNEISFSIYSYSGLPLTGQSLDSSVCDIYLVEDIANVIFNAAGDCELSFFQEGNYEWTEITEYISFQILANPKKSKPQVYSTPSKKPSVSGSASGSSGSKSGSSTGEVSGSITGGSAAKKTTITCMKGSSIKKITDVKPVCPAGYKKK